MLPFLIRDRIKSKNMVLGFLFALSIFGLSLLYAPKRAEALCFLCQPALVAAEDIIWEEARDEFDAELDEQFRRLERFIIHTMWEQSILPAMMLAAEQFTAVALQQAMAIGMFIDAENQLAAQRMLQEIQAQAHKNYQPSEGLCEFGSVMKSLAASERLGEATAVVLSQRSQDRQLGQVDTIGAYGHEIDKGGRIGQFRSVFCNPADRNGVTGDGVTSYEVVCYNLHSGNHNYRVPRMDMDIDYFSLFDGSNNLGIDFTNEVIVAADASAPEDGDIHNEDEEHIFAMAANLYGYDNFARIPAMLITNKPDKHLSAAQKAYMDMRSIVAKRSVAENSFYAIAGMKTQGVQHERLDSSGNPVTDANGRTVMDPISSREYMESILEGLGVPNAEVVDILGNSPSYYAQMEILTKKIYQSPDFYTNLYDKPANVKRKTVAMQAIKLMQKFDMLKSFLRGEASVSILLELAIVELQGEIEDQIMAIGVEGG
ncbi:MAG: hypothetical protein ACRBDL_06545 [Alphaproteobacteria bacterium]